MLVVGVGGLMALTDVPQSAAAAESVGNTGPNLPVVFLDSKGSISSDRDRRASSTLKIVSRNGSEAAHTNSWPGVVRIHGATSQALPKKSFSIALEAPARLLDMREHSHWIL